MSNYINFHPATGEAINPSWKVNPHNGVGITSSVADRLKIQAQLQGLTSAIPKGEVPIKNLSIPDYFARVGKYGLGNGTLYLRGISKGGNVMIAYNEVLPLIKALNAKQPLPELKSILVNADSGIAAYKKLEPVIDAAKANY